MNDTPSAIIKIQDHRYIEDIENLAQIHKNAVLPPLERYKAAKDTLGKLYWVGMAGFALPALKVYLFSDVQITGLGNLTLTFNNLALDWADLFFVPPLLGLIGVGIYKVYGTFQQKSQARKDLENSMDAVISDFNDDFGHLFSWDSHHKHNSRHPSYRIARSFHNINPLAEGEVFTDPVLYTSVRKSLEKVYGPEPKNL